MLARSALSISHMLTPQLAIAFCAIRHGSRDAFDRNWGGRASARQGGHRALFRPCRAPPSLKSRPPGAVTIADAGRLVLALLYPTKQTKQHSLIVPFWQAGRAQVKDARFPQFCGAARAAHKIGSPTPRWRGADRRPADVPDMLRTACRLTLSHHEDDGSNRRYLWNSPSPASKT